MRTSNRYHRSPFSLRALFGLHSESTYTRKHHGHRQTRRAHRSHTPRAAPTPSAYYNYPSGGYSNLYSQDYHTSYQPRQTEYSHAPSTSSHKTHHHKSHHSKRSKRTNLNSLPPELKHQIHSSLDPVSSTCLGLSSRHYYPIHASHHPKVSLFTMDPSPSTNSTSRSAQKMSHPLYMYLMRDQHSHFVPREGDGYILDPISERYVKRAGFEERERERKSRGERFVWEEGRAERERELRRIWGREGKLGRRRGRGWFW